MAKRTDITEAAIRRAADGKSCRRGEGYFRRGMVSSLQTEGDVVVGTVSGTDDYDVRLWADDGEVDGECSCPRGRSGVFCKHLVAAGLTHLAGGVVRVPDDGDEAGQPPRLQPPPGPKVTMDDVRERLLQKPSADLVEIIVRQAERDDHLRRSLLLEAARRLPGGLDVATFRVAVDAATEAGDFVEHHDVYIFTSGIEDVVDAIGELLEAGHAADVVELTEHALRRCEQALQQMDDSDGEMWSILGRLQELHHAACVKARPDPEALARRLFQWELEARWDTFRGSVETYADVLGEKGLAVYRALAEETWKKVPQLGPGDHHSCDGSRHSITSIMQSLARSSGDVETAWQEGQAGGCSDSLWMALSERREPEHPADALAVYRRQVDAIVNMKSNDAYRKAAQLIRTIQKLMVRLDREGDVPEYLESVRKTHKPKRNFMAMLKDM